MKKSLYAVMAMLLLVTACGKKEDKAAAEAAQKPKDYKVLTVQPMSATLNEDYPATIQGQQDIDIRPRVEGYIQSIFVDEGAVVKAGQPLFKISAPQYEQEVKTATASVKSAQADVSAAKLAINKVKPLVDKDIISKYELESAQYNYQAALATLAQAQASLANARTNVGFTTVNSPVDGVVGSIPFRLGTLVSPANAEPLTTVASIGNVYAYFSFNEKQLLRFAKDSTGTFEQKIDKMPKVSLLLSDGSVYAQKGTIETIAGLVNTNTGSVNVRAQFPNPKGIIRSGTSTKVRIPEAVSNVIIIPQSATFELQDKMFASVLGADGKTKNAIITVNETTIGTYYVVESGLKPGDTIVLEGVANLKEGTQIKAVQESADKVYANLNKQ